MRQCGNCYQDLPSSRFRENHRSEHGFHPNCISCQDAITGMTVIPELRSKAAVKNLPVRGRVDKQKLP